MKGGPFGDILKNAKKSHKAEKKPAYILYLAPLFFFDFFSWVISALCDFFKICFSPISPPSAGVHIKRVQLLYIFKLNYSSAVF